MATSVPLSLLDLARVLPAESAAEGIARSVRLARTADDLGYHRLWVSEHHNMPGLASSATSLYIQHLAAHTTRLRVGAGGIMLPNHSPLVIAEQFGLLETLFPGRIDLGLGRAPGTDGATMAALRRDARASEHFPSDIVELDGYLTGTTKVPGVHAYPHRSAGVPLFILGSSLYGAQLAAQLGLPYAFASHFAPEHLEEAVAIYRRDFKPSEQLAEPYAIAGVNVVAAPDAEEAGQLLTDARRSRTRSMLSRTPAGSAAEERFSDEEVDAFLASPQGRGIAGMMRCTAAGTPEQVHEQLEAFAVQAQADELICAHAPREVDARIRSVELTGATLATAA